MEDLNKISEKLDELFDIAVLGNLPPKEKKATRIKYNELAKRYNDQAGRKVYNYLKFSGLRKK